MNEALELLLRRRLDQGDRPGRDGVRHADGTDHAVRRGRPRHGRVRRHDDVRGVSRSRRRLAARAGDGQAGPPRPKIGPAASSRYQNKKGRAEADPAVDEADRAPIAAASESSRARRLTHRLFLPMLLEATRMLEEQDRPRRARRRSGPDLRPRLSAVQRRPAVLGRYARRGEARRNAQAAGAAGPAVPADAAAARNGRDRAASSIRSRRSHCMYRRIERALP